MVHELTAMTVLTGIVATNWIKPSTFHLRLLLCDRVGPSVKVDRILGENPFTFPFFASCHIVAEVSSLPSRWKGEVKQLVDHHVGC